MPETPTAASANGMVSTPLPKPAEPPIHEAIGLSRERLLEMFEVMLLARAVDEREWILNRQGREAFHISCQGHEGSGVGSAFALNRELDVMIPYYRSLAAVLAFGMTPLQVFLSALARAADPISGGRQMPAHYGLTPRILTCVKTTTSPSVCRPRSRWRSTVWLIAPLAMPSLAPRSTALILWRSIAA